MSETAKPSSSLTSTSSLSARPNLKWLKNRAKDRLRELRTLNPNAQLTAAQFDLAKRFGFKNWVALTKHIESNQRNAAAQPPDDLVKAFADAMNRDRGDVEAIRTLLDQHPQLANCHPWAPAWPHSAIEAVAHQCVWHRPKMHEIAKLLIERGAVADLPTVARAGLVDEVTRRLDADSSLVNKPDAQGRTAIYRAACTYGFLKESIPVVEALIARGATVDLFTAAPWLMMERLEPMLARDPRLAKAVDPEGLTALHWVTRTDSEDPRQVAAATLLLDAGANVDAAGPGNEAMRPLHCAAEWPASNALIELLIDRGADVNGRAGKSLWTPLDYAIDRNREAARDLLRSRGGKTRQELDATTDAAADAFLTLVFRGDVVPVGAALDASPDLVNRIGKHPQWGGRPQALHVAIERGDRPMFDLLLARGANADGDNGLYDHWSPLMLAIHWKRDDMRDELLKRVDHVSLISALMMADDTTAMKIMALGAIMLQRPMPNDATMLHFARTPTAATRLIEMGVAIDAKDKYGKTPLDLAAERGDRALVEMLIERGATASAVTFARLGDLPRLKKSLAGATPDRKVFDAAIIGDHLKVVRWMLAQGVDVNATNDTGTIPLHTAAFEGRLAIAKLLVKAGSNIHAEDDEYNATPAGWAQHAAQNLNRLACLEVVGYLEQLMATKTKVTTMPPRKQSQGATHWKPIMDAAFAGDATTIVKLIEEGADPNVTSKTAGGHRPLHRAMEEKSTAPRGPKHEAAVKALLAHGADPRLRGAYDDHTALQLAAVEAPRFVPLLIDAFRPLDIFHACAVLDAKRVTALVKKDPSLATTPEVNRYTPLHYVAASRMYRLSARHLKDQLMIAKLLLDTGADANGAYPWGGPGNWPISVLYFACGRNDNPQLTELLMTAGADPCDNESVYHAADEGHDACLAVLERLTDPKKLASEATMSLRTQMHWGKWRGAKWLLAHGADPNSLHPQSGNSALHSAIVYGSNDKVIALLLTNGADPKRKNAHGQTAFDLAKASPRRKRLEAALDGKRGR